MKPDLKYPKGIPYLTIRASQENCDRLNELGLKCRYDAGINHYAIPSSLYETVTKDEPKTIITSEREAPHGITFDVTAQFESYYEQLDHTSLIYKELSL